MRFFTLREAVILSICLHLLLGGLLLIRKATEERPEPQAVTVELLPMSPPAVAANVKAAKKRDFVKPHKEQIVEQDAKQNQEKPKDDAFLSATNQNVQHQTVARERGDFKNQHEAKTKTAAKSAGEKNPTENLQAKNKPSLRDLTPTYDPQGLFDKKIQAETARGGDDDSKTGADVSQTNDYLRGIDEGLETMLNTREFKYYTYYTRIRRQLSQHWEPKVKERLSRMFKQGRRIASDQDHVTKLLITLSDQGNLVKVQILGESGVSDLDDAAMDAFRAAAPFPNPPKGIVEPDGTVKIRWDFVLES